MKSRKNKTEYIRSFGIRYMTRVSKSKQIDSNKCLLYAGTYTTNGGEGIYVYKMDFVSGSHELIEVQRNVDNPSYLTFNEERSRLYAVMEISEFEGEYGGAVCAYAVDKESGRLSFINQKPSQGRSPCFVSLSNTGNNLFVSNYSGGSIAVFTIGANGELAEMTDFKQHHQTGSNPDRQTKPHPHSIIPSPGNDYVLVPDLGSDKIFIYEAKHEKAGLKLQNRGDIGCETGSGPRHIVFGSKGNFLYIINELDSTISVFEYDQCGKDFTNVQKISTLPPDFNDWNAPAEIKVHPSGNYIYGSNRGHNTIAIFKIDKNNGDLTSIGHESTRGNIPRNFCFDPTGQYLLASNRKSNNITVFAVDENTGKLEFTGQEVEIPEPACIKTISC